MAGLCSGAVQRSILAATKVDECESILHETFSLDGCGSCARCSSASFVLVCAADMTRQFVMGCGCAVCLLELTRLLVDSAVADRLGPVG
jgi:hypothetical protein